MKVISATAISKLIEAHMEKDEKKFLSYANFIADAYEEQGEKKKARIIRSRIDGTYKNQKKISIETENAKEMSRYLLQFLGLKYLTTQTQHNYYLEKTGEIYNGQIYMHGNGEPLTDGNGNIVIFR